MSATYIPLYRNIGIVTELSSDLVNFDGGVFQPGIVDILPDMQTTSNSAIVPTYPVFSTGGFFNCFPMPSSYFFDRIFTFPSSIDFGLLAEDTTVPVSLCSTFTREKRTLENKSESDSSSFDTLEPIPFTLLPHEQKTFNAIAYKEGNYLLEDTVTWEFYDYPYPVTLSSSGYRGIVLNFFHDWGSTFSIAFSYTTNVFNGYNGVTYKSSLKERPLRTLTASLMAMEENETSVLKATLSRLLGVSSFGFPLYSDGAEVVSYDSPTLTVTCSNLSGLCFKEGMPVLVAPDSLVNHSESAYLLKIASVSGDTITFVSFPSGEDLVAGNIIYPVVAVSGMAGDLRGTLSGPTMSFNLSATEIDGVTQILEDAYSGTEWETDQNDIPIFLLDYDWSTSPVIGAKGFANFTDIGTGKVRTDLSSRPSRFWSGSVMVSLTDRETLQAITSLFFRCKGRAGSFWFLDRHPGLDVIEVNEHYVSISSLSGNPDLIKKTWGHVAILTNSSYITRGIADVTNPNEGVLYLYFDNPITGTQATNATNAFFAAYASFASDTLEVVCDTTVAYLNISIEENI